MKSHSSFIPWICLAATAGAPLAFASDGVGAYREGHYIQATQELANSSAKDPIVDYYMGRMRLYGYGALRNNITALRDYQHAAEKGFLPAQRTMALYSLLKDNNPEQALYWFRKAAISNDISAQMYCAAAYLFGFGTKKNEDMAKHYYIDAAKSGNAIAQYTLAQDFLNSKRVESKKLGLIWLNKAVDQHNPAAQLSLGLMYANGTLVDVDQAKAQELIGLSVAQGYLPALYQMGLMAQKDKDLAKAKDWYTKAAMAHYTPAEIALSQLYTQDKTPLTDPHLGFLWMLKAAQNGSIEAQTALATMYKNGQGVEASESSAKDWQDKATLAAKAKETNEAALVKVAQWLSGGKADNLAASGYRLRGIFSDWQNPDALRENNYNQSPEREVVTRAALYKPNFVMANPNDIAINEYYDALASLLSHSTPEAGLGLPQYAIDKQLPASLQSTGSDEVLVKYLQGRAVVGDSTAQFTLGQLYQEGIGTHKDVDAAIKQYQLASDQEDLRAEYNLALIYLEGNGVPADYQKAVSLLRDAAFKGNDYAQYALGRIDEVGYRNPAGEEVLPVDKEHAAVMYDLAAANDYGLAQYRLAELLVREKKTDISVAAKQQRRDLLKQLYEGAYTSGIQQAALPLAFFNAMEKSKNKQAQAFDVAKTEANQGSAGAALLLGLMYDRGIGVAADQNEAVQWYQKAETNPVTAFILGTYYHQGSALSKDEAKSKQLLQQSADAGFAYANLNLAVFKQQNKEPFLPELQKALALGNSSAGLLLADYYLSNANDSVQMNQARDIYQQLADKGDKDAQLKLGFMFEQGLGGNKDLANAEKWYGLAADQGQVVAQYMLGRLNELGLLQAQPDYEIAKKWYSSAQSTYAPAAVALGFMNETVDDNYQRAIASYEIAVAQQDTIGQFNLGLVYEKGKGRPVDFAKARDLYQQAADAGHHQAMVQLAGLYFNGSLGSRDEEQALSWYKKAAALGDRDALYQLGLLSETGVALSVDVSTAIQYYQQSADKGNAKGMLALARIYQYGSGVPKNASLAEKYYQQLASLGNAYAQYQLATLYYEGIDGKRIPQQGKALLVQAAANGSEQASRTLQWLNAQAQDRISFVEPVLLTKPFPELAQQPAELMYLDALNEWNRGDERSSKCILNQLIAQFPEFAPAKKAYEQLNQELTPEALVS